MNHATMITMLLRFYKIMLTWLMVLSSKAHVKVEPSPLTN